MRMSFSITLWETWEPTYSLEVDGQVSLDEIPKGNLDIIFREMEKYARLRFKGELTHKKSTK